MVWIHWADVLIFLFDFNYYSFDVTSYYQKIFVIWGVNMIWWFLWPLSDIRTLWVENIWFSAMSETVSNNIYTKYFPSLCIVRGSGRYIICTTIYLNNFFAVDGQWKKKTFTFTILLIFSKHVWNKFGHDETFRWQIKFWVVISNKCSR